MPNIDDQTFEQSFAEMAITDLQSKAPALVNYMLGFQLVEKSDDATRAVGFFGFRPGESYIYVPCFFLSGEIKGTEMMYVKGQDLFLPLAEGWVNYVIRRKPFMLGKAVEKKREDQGVSAPDLRRLRVPPSEAKIASDRWSAWAQGGLDMLSKIAAEVQSSIPSLPDVLARTGNTIGFVQQMRDDPKLASLVLRFYQPEDFLKAAADTDSTPATPLSSDDHDWFRVFEGEKALQDPAVTFMSEKEKEQLLRGNTIIRDGRHETAKRKVYGVELTRKLTNPTDGGFYDVLRMDGGLGKALVVQPHTIGEGGSRDIRMVLDPKTKKFAILNKSAVHVSHQYEWQDCAKELEDLGETIDDCSFSKDEQYCIIAGCQAYGPFRVEKRLENEDGTTTLLVRSCIYLKGTDDRVNHESRDRKQRLPFDAVLFDDTGTVSIGEGGSSTLHPHSGYGSFGSLERIILSDKPLRRAVQSRGVLLVPRKGEFRAVKLDGEFSVESSPATTADLYLGVSKLASEIKVWHDGVETYVQHEGKTAKAANEAQGLRVLIHGLGLAEEPSREILKVAHETPRKVTQYWVERREKRAAFDHPDFNASYDQYFGAPVQQGGVSVAKLLPEHASFDQASAAQYQHFPDENVAKYQKLYQDDINVMDQAAQTGQKDVFDASAIGALINTGDVNEEIDGYISDLVKGLDKLGRTLFLMYWHSEDLIERYGKNEYRDLSDNVKSVFQKLGDTVLDMRQRVPGDDDFISRTPVS